jgi:hypothetical protein
MMDTTHGSQTKYELGGTDAPIDAGDLPWAYGEDRITAVVRDPDSAYVYWEITNEGIASARARLGPEGQHGWCNLRVYDTTGREFDGTNANDYFDIRVDRNDREYYVMIRRPSSAMHVEIGVKTREGFFQPVARSGRAEFPRNAPSQNTSLEWMNVTSRDAPPCVAPYRSRYRGPEPRLPIREGGGYVDVWRAAYAPSMPADGTPVREHASWSTTTHKTVERHAHIERWWRLDEWRSEWRAGLRFYRWEHFDPQRVVVELLGESPFFMALEGGEMVAYGPWRVTIKGFESEPGRRVLSTWAVRWVRATTPMIERWEHFVEREILSGYEREHLVLGASEQQRLLERGASELLRIGGSERLWMGASEWQAAGASETLWLGASETAYGGASAFLWRGGSEWLGASERMGASERFGESLLWLGGSEQALGASRIGGGSEQTMSPVLHSGEPWAVRPEERT